MPSQCYLKSAISAAAFTAGLLLANVGPAAAVRSAADASAPKVVAKVYKRPLMRAGRVQYCLKATDLYDGRINGRYNVGTRRALRRLQDDVQMRSSDVEQDWALHAVLWRRCRSEWAEAGGVLDRFGIATYRTNGAANGGIPVAGVQQAARTLPLPPSPPATAPDGIARTCVAPELRQLLVAARGTATAVPACSLPCLAKPETMDGDDAQAYTRNFGVTWCKSCVPFTGDLPLDDIRRIEAAGSITLCPERRGQPRALPAPPARLVVDAVRGVRAYFRRDLRPSAPHGDIAVVVGVSDYGPKVPRRMRSERDAAAVHALLTERLGFRGNRVIELKDPKREEIEAVFGRAGSPRGLLSERLKDAAGSNVFVYVSALGAVGDGEAGAMLLPSDARPGDDRGNGFALQTLYQNLAAIGAGRVNLVLEVDFAVGAPGVLVAPNAPITQAPVVPERPLRGLTVITAGDRDQRLLEDGESGLSLFTRHLIASLSGDADRAPTGNEDGAVDTVEAFVDAAQATGYAARKVQGVTQRPMLSQSGNPTIVRLGARTQR